MFRKKKAEIIRRGVVGADGAKTTESNPGTVAEVKRKRFATGEVEIKRIVIDSPPAQPARTVRPRQKASRRDAQQTRAPARARTAAARNRVRREHAPPPREVTEDVEIPVSTEKKQMLVRGVGEMMQIAVLEGPKLVEHYVARPERESLVGNVYLGRVQNVLPGMEAAFVDFGSRKNGVIYAGDVQYDASDIEEGRPRIEKALKAGDALVVQVTKDAMGSKGARLTNMISLAGRHLVLAPDSDVRGISRRLPELERNRLRDLLKELRPKGFGVIARTAAEGAPEDALRADLEALLSQWAEIQKKAADAQPPTLIYAEPELVQRVVREHFTPDFRKLLVSDKPTHTRIVEYLAGVAADMLNRVELYDDERLELFERYHVDEQIQRALDKKVWLPSGGYLIVEKTEALTVIDVNTGKFVGQNSTSLEETVLTNNLEAAEEIGRQLRLRDIGGIIIIDFIDMELEKNRQAVMRKFRETLARDKTRTQVFEISNLGLVEMTRKNVSESLLETFSETCPRCEGRGYLYRYYVPHDLAEHRHATTPAEAPDAAASEPSPTEAAAPTGP